MSHIDLDALPTYTKQQLAGHQLDMAIRMLLDYGDPVCAITLAGAAEEILGKILEVEKGEPHSLEQFIGECLAAGRQLGEDWKPKDFAAIANFYRNELKHYTDGTSVTICPECAHWIIDRAAENLWRLTGRQSMEIQRYMAHIHDI